MSEKSKIKVSADLASGLILKLYEEPPDSVITWTVPYKQFSTGQQRAACFMDGSCKQNFSNFHVYMNNPNHQGILLKCKFWFDGGVEGRALTPSCENTRITTNCWTIINRKTLELTKKDTTHPKTKEKPQWDGRRGAITVKSNPITAGSVTHKLENIYTTEVHPWSEVSEPHVRLPKLGVWQWEEEFLENQTLKASRIWLQDFDRTGGNRDSTLGGHTQSSVHIGTQGKKQWPHRRLNQTYR